MAATTSHRINVFAHVQGNRLTMYFMLLLSCLACLPDITSGQDILVRSTIREQRLPGYQIADLRTVKEFTAAAPSDIDLRFNILTSGNPSSDFFTVEEEVGVVRIAKSIDREVVCSFRPECVLDFTVAARAVYGQFFLLVNFRVEVTDFNDNPPEFTETLFELNIPENSESGREFQLPVAYDRDTGVNNGVKEYVKLQGPPLFDIRQEDSGTNSTDLYLVLLSAVNRETSPSYKVLVGAVDGGQPSLTGTLTVEVKVSDINDNFPTFEKPVYMVTIPEDTRNDKVIQKVHATDLDAGVNGQLVYSFSSLQPLDDLQYFNINPRSGEIYLTKSIETRTGSDIELLVEARDQGHPPKVSRTRVKIEVEDTVNSMPEVIVDTLGGHNGVADVSEYGEIGKVVAYVSVTDPDTGDNGRTDCRISGPQFVLETLDKGKYKVKLGFSLDREATSMYNMTVSCSDHGLPSLTASADFAVRVLDENDETPEFSLKVYTATVTENNAPGQLVRKLEVTDKDIGQNAEVFFEVMNPNKRFFSVLDNGDLIAREPLDRETTDILNVTVMVTDKGQPPRSSSASVIITLLDANDEPPRFDDMIYRFNVDEGQPIGKYIGMVMASDKDLGINRLLEYYLPEDYINGENTFKLDKDSGVLKTNAVLDREKENSHDFIVLAVDQGVPPLTGTASVMITVNDVNDNDPFFLFPNANNNSLVIPHSFDMKDNIVFVKAQDNDIGLNADLVYSISSTNASAPFMVNSQTGALYLSHRLEEDDCGLYTLTVMANDQGTDQERGTQIPLYMQVFFDNSTLYAAVDAAAPSNTIITVAIVLSVVLLLGVVVLATFICYKRHEAKRGHNGVPNSSSSSSTAKLHGGYYVAPGVSRSSSTFLGKEDGNSNRGIDTMDGMKTTNPYVIMGEGRNNGNSNNPEIVEIACNGHHPMSDPVNTLDLDQVDNDFSTFKVQEEIMSPGYHGNSLGRRSQVSDMKRPMNDTFDDDLSLNSTSDSGRGGSDVEAAKDRARSKAATPISMKSGISNRLSPIPGQVERGNTFRTFRGDSPSSFPFDSDNDTLTRNLTVQRNPNFEPMTPSSLLSGRPSESDNEDPGTPRPRPVYPSHMGNLASIHNPNSSYNGNEGSLPRLPHRVVPLPSFTQPSSYQRPDSETDPDLSDAGSNRSGSLRRSHVPRMPYYPGIEFSHQGSNRNSGFSNRSSASDSAPQDTLYTPTASQVHVDYDSNNSTPYHSSDYNIPVNPPNRQIFSTFGNNAVSELDSSRPLSTDSDFLLPPYPDIQENDEDEATNLSIRPGFSEDSPLRGDRVRAILFHKSKFESSA